LEKIDDTEREIQRRNMGKNMLKTKEQLEMEQRKREGQLRRREKDDSKRERQRLREELAKDKAERAAQGGKLASRLGVEGYKPDGIQYNETGEEQQKEDLTAAAAAAAAPNQAKPPPPKVSAAKVGEYIAKVSGYRAGGDGGKCLKILNLIVSKVLENPSDAKFRSVGTDTNTYKTKIKPFIGAKNLLMACGFQPEEKGDKLILSDDADLQVLVDTKAKLEAAITAYG
jgi:UBX domain-containing protein 1/4